MKRMYVDRARRLRRTMTDAERCLWRHLRNRHFSGWKFRRQHEIDRYIVDFVCPDAFLVVELDGGQHAETVAADAERTRRLQGMGYHVLRFWNNDVLMNTEAVLGVVLEALARAAPHPTLSPQGRGSKRAHGHSCPKTALPPPFGERAGVKGQPRAM
ncbi:endonuclease domain-containing protein [Dyella jejuensis]|uniref:Endonuclease domain-containing protein n=1 Tax=Dyella jejuensis TaxID=1432009 RepID=A0ABW8JK40_9GAMM